MSDDESLIDDVTQFEQQVVDLFNARGGDGPDEVAPSSPGDGGEDEAPPESTGGASAPDDLSFIEPADTDDATVDTPVESEQLNVAEPTDGPDDDLLIDQVWGDIPEENLPTARAVYDWYSQLDENAIAQIDATLSGQYVLVPAQQIETLQNNWDLLESVRSGEYQRQNVDVDDEYSDNVSNNPDIDALNQRIAQLEAEKMQEQQAVQLQQTASVIDATYVQWRDQHPELSDDDFARLEAAVVQSGMFGPLAAQYGDVQATVMALDQMLYANPEFRNKAIEPLVNEKLQAELQAAQEQQARGQRASSISGAAAGPPGETAVNLDPEEAMIEEITRALRG
jgi:hypothetical protein